MDLVKILEKFQELMKMEYRNKGEAFIEREGRLIFLAFLKPVINGSGFYFVEPQSRNNTRMDIVIIYNQIRYKEYKKECMEIRGKKIFNVVV